MIITVVVLSIIAYLIGSLSSAIIVCKLFKLPDPRTEGSKNPGTTNVLRIGGKVPAIFTLTGDMLKGFLPVLIGHLVGISGLFLGIIAACAVIGHVFPVFLKFQGGKGVATSLGAFLALSPIAGVVIIAAWILTAIITRYSSFSSVIAAILAPIFMLILANRGYFLPVLIISALLIWRHLDNIQKLRAGTEGKIKL